MPSYCFFKRIYIYIGLRGKDESQTPAWEKSLVFKSSPAAWAANWTPSSNVWQLQPALGNEVTEESRDISNLWALSWLNFDNPDPQTASLWIKIKSHTKVVTLRGFKALLIPTVLLQTSSHFRGQHPAFQHFSISLFKLERTCVHHGSGHSSNCRNSTDSGVHQTPIPKTSVNHCGFMKFWAGTWWFRRISEDFWEFLGTWKKNPKKAVFFT